MKDDEKRSLEDLIDSAFDDDCPSITKVNGTVARFGMSYGMPEEDRHVFRAPLSQVAPSVVYAAFAVLVAGFIFAVHASGSSGSIYRFIVEDDAGRALPSRPFAVLLLVSAAATLVRAWLRGVVVSEHGIEARELGTFALPRVQRWMWVQIDRVIIDRERGRVLVQLWNGRRALLPPVRDGARLSEVLLGVGLAHKKDVATLD